MAVQGCIIFTTGPLGDWPRVAHELGGGGIMEHHQQVKLQPFGSAKRRKLLVVGDIQTCHTFLMSALLIGGFPAQ